MQVIGRGSLGLAAVVSALSLGGAASAQEWYARGEIGVGMDGEADLDADAPISGDLDVDSADYFALAAGRDWGGWRLEGELARRQTDLDPSLALDEGGSIDSTAFMISLYRDFLNGPVQPFVGAGIGIARSEVKLSNSAPLLPVSIDDDDTTLAYQIVAGAALQLADHVSVEAAYRYFAANGAEGTGASLSAPDFDYEAESSQQGVSVGLRFTF